MSTNGRLFLDESLPSLEDKTVDEVASLIDSMAASVTEADVKRQIAEHERQVAEMKAFMQKAVDEGVIVDDDEDKEGTMLLKSKSGDYNPIMDAHAKQQKETSAAEKAVPLQDAKKSSPTVLIVVRPFSRKMKRRD